MIETWYHGTPRWHAILQEGVDIDAPKHSDPGDFGWGIYLTKKLSRAQIYGRVLEIQLDTSNLAYIPNPYFLEGLRAIPPTTIEERLFHWLAFEEGEMKTLAGTFPERTMAAREIQQGFLKAGYSGIISDYDEGEAVLFESSPVVSIKLL